MIQCSLEFSLCTWLSWDLEQICLGENSILLNSFYLCVHWFDLYIKSDNVVWSKPQNVYDNSQYHGLKHFQYFNVWCRSYASDDYHPEQLSNLKIQLYPSQSILICLFFPLHFFLIKYKLSVLWHLNVFKMKILIFYHCFPISLSFWCGWNLASSPLFITTYDRSHCVSRTLSTLIFSTKSWLLISLIMS